MITFCGNSRADFAVACLTVQQRELCGWRVVGDDWPTRPAIPPESRLVIDSRRTDRCLPDTIDRFRWRQPETDIGYRSRCKSFPVQIDLVAPIPTDLIPPKDSDGLSWPLEPSLSFLSLQIKHSGHFGRPQIESQRKSALTDIFGGEIFIDRVLRRTGLCTRETAERDANQSHFEVIRCDDLLEQVRQRLDQLFLLDFG